MVFLKGLTILDLGFGFLVNNCVYSRLGTRGSLQFGQQIIKKPFESIERAATEITPRSDPNGRFLGLLGLLHLLGLLGLYNW